MLGDERVENNNQLIETMPFWEKLSEREKQLLIDGSREEAFEKGKILNRTDEECKGIIFTKAGK